MENSMVISKSREDSKLILKNMPKAVQATCDKVFVAGADLGGRIVATNESDSAFRIALLDASNAFGAVKDSPYKGFADFACAVFGFTSAPAVTNAVKVAEHIDLPQIPKLSAWYSTGMLYELRDVPAERLKADVESGALHAGMTMKELREYNRSCKLEDGDDMPALVPMFTAHITPAGGETLRVDGTLEEIKLAMWNALGVDASMDEDRYGSFNPHATELRGKREVKGKGIALVFGVKMVSAVYFPIEREKKTESAVEAQNATIAKLMARIAELEAAQA